MTTRNILQIFTFFLFIYSCQGSKLLVILMDGIRWDYFSDPGLQLPAFQKFFREGVRAEYIYPDFPSVSLPNYYTLMTGLHTENHGIVSNFMYSEEHNETFELGVNPEHINPHWWNDAEPLWVTAEKNGKKAYFYYWRGCDVAIRGVKPTFCEVYKLSMIPEFQYSIKSAIQNLKNGAELIGIYLEATDKYGHKYGPKSAKMNHMMELVDIEFGNLLGNLTSEGFDDDLNVIIFSDHGMAEVTGIVDLRSKINFEDIHHIIPEDTLIDIWPKNGKKEKVYNDLVAQKIPQVTVYKKENVPERYHYRSHRLIPPIIIVPDDGKMMCTDKNPEKCLKGYKGHHGYDNKLVDMRAIFAAKGPAFKKNYVAQPMANTEIYQVMCSVLGVPAQPHNGTWNMVKDMMAPPSSSSCTSFSVMLGFFSIMINFLYHYF